MPIPDLNAHGVLPPHKGDGPTRLTASPYPATTLELCEKFSTSRERRAILKNFLEFRALLRQLGVVEGFQWVDGSFLEDHERRTSKAPDYIQVVTFLRKSPLFSHPDYADLVAPLKSRKATRGKFNVDHMLVPLDGPADAVVNHTAYYFSLLSHQNETKVWKGLLRIDLNTAAEDNAAMAHLESLEGA